MLEKSDLSQLSYVTICRSRKKCYYQSIQFIPREILQPKPLPKAAKCEGRIGLKFFPILRLQVDNTASSWKLCMMSRCVSSSAVLNEDDGVQQVHAAKHGNGGIVRIRGNTDNGCCRQGADAHFTRRCIIMALDRMNDVRYAKRDRRE
jgi:hypothetical protein